jgi:hypothetical protein
LLNGRIVLAALFVVSAALAIIPTSSAEAATKTATLTPLEQAQSFAYYKALRTCFATGWYKASAGFTKRDYFEPTDATNFDWFNGRQGVSATNGINVGAFNDPRGISGDGSQNCGDSEGEAWIAKALALWGYSAATVPQLLCNEMKFTRDSSEVPCTDMTPGADNSFVAPSDAPGKLDAFWRSTLGGGSVGIDSITGSGGAYRLYLDNFKSQCRPSERGTTYTIREYDAAADPAWSTKRYGAPDTGRTPSYQVTVWDQKTMSCADLAAAIDSDEDSAVKGYKAWNQNNPTEFDNPPVETYSAEDANTAPTCGSTIAGIGWLLCPVLTAIGGLNDAMWSFASALLTVAPLSQTQTDAAGGTSESLIFTAWRTFQSIANVVLVIAFLLIVFSQLTGAGISNYGVKKTLPRLILVAVLINISFIVMQIAFDAANIVGSSLYDLIKGVSGDPVPPNWGQLITTVISLGAAGGVAVGLISIAPEAALMMLVPGALAAVLGFIAAVLTLMFRQAIVPILAILAPLAFAAYLLPNTKPWFDRWWKLTSSMLLLFPLAAVLFGGVQLSANLINSGGEWWQTLTALIVLGAPLFMLPFLARQAGPALGKLNSNLRGLGGKLQKPVGSWADSRKKLALARSDAGPVGGNRFKAARQWLGRRRQDRELRTSAFNAEQQETYNAGLIGREGTLTRGMRADGAGQATVRATVTRAQGEQIKLAMDSMRAGAGFNPNDRGALAGMLDQAIRSGDHVRATAATNFLVAARGIDELHSTVAGAQSGGYLSPVMTRTMQGAVTSSENGSVVRERRRDLSTWGSQGGELSAITNAADTWNLSAEDTVKLSSGGLAAARASGGVSAETAARVLDTPMLRSSLDGTKEPIFMQIAGRARASTTPSLAAPSSPAAPTSYVDGLGRSTPGGASGGYHDGMSK